MRGRTPPPPLPPSPIVAISRFRDFAGGPITLAKKTPIGSVSQFGATFRFWRRGGGIRKCPQRKPIRLSGRFNLRLPEEIPDVAYWRAAISSAALFSSGGLTCASGGNVKGFPGGNARRVFFVHRRYSRLATLRKGPSDQGQLPHAGGGAEIGKNS